jgi:DNA-binding helix-hairpin-helix protein with protein kinase domain
MKCKRCGKELLLRSEEDLALCAICQQVLSHPPLIEPSFERTSNELSYLIDDLYCLDRHGSAPPKPCPSSVRPTTPRHAPPRPAALPATKRGVVGLFLSSIAAITITLLTVAHLRPHLVGLNGFDLLAIAACFVSWWFVFKEVGESVR